MGCEQRPKSKDVWLEAARLHVSFRPLCLPFSCFLFRCVQFEGPTHIFVSCSEVRTLVGLLLRDLVGVRMLGEQAQISAIQELSKAYLKRWPAMMPGQTAPNPLVLTIALREVAGLLQQLGNAPSTVQVSHYILFRVNVEVECNSGSAS